MRILLIEDDEFKATQIIDFLNTQYKSSIEVKKSFQTGMKSICNNKFDVLLLDMSMPTFEISPDHPTSRHRPFGGKEILNEMKRLDIKIPTVVVTQYNVFGEGRDSISVDELNDMLSNEFDQVYYGMVHYNAGAIDWYDELIKFIEKITKEDNEKHD